MALSHQATEYLKNIQDTTIDGRQKTKLVDSSGNLTDAQYPLPCDGESVYAKDINIDFSSVGDFSGVITDFFDNLHSTQTAPAVSAGGVNPKSFTISLQRPIANSTFAMSSQDTSISNVKITLKTLSGLTVKVLDFSTDNTKRSVQLFQYPQIFFTDALVEFYTDDAVSIEAVGILKSVNVNIDAISGIISDDNSTNIPLLANATFTGGIIDTKNYGIIVCSAYADVTSAEDGLSIEFSSDRVNWYWTDVYTIAAGAAKTFSVQTQARYLRVIYTNGPADQTAFNIETTLKPVYIKPSSHRVKDSVSEQDDSELVKAVLSGVDEVSGIFENVKTFGGALNVTDGLVHKAPINLYFSRDLGGSTNPSSPISSGDTTVTFDDTTGFAIGDSIQIQEGLVYEMIPLIITAIATNDVTFNRPVDKDYTIAARIDEIEVNMNKDGSVTPIHYQIVPPSGQIWQITRIIISMLDDTSMDDGKFGGMTALPNGVLLRTVKSNVVTSAALWQTNGDMASDMFDVQYASKAPSGEFGLRARWTFTKLGAIVELDGTNSDFVELVVQDSITGLNNFAIKAQGRIFGA